MLETYIPQMECSNEITPNGRFVVKVWDDGCPFCVEYAPIFDKVVAELNMPNCSFKVPRNIPSAFREKYMLENGKEKKSVPATILFEGGQVVNIAWGRLFEPQLKEFITTGQVAPKAPPSPHDYAKTASSNDLKASMIDLGEQIKNNQIIYDIFYQELQRRNNT